MKLSAKSEYALRALIEMAGLDDKKPVGVREIASKQGIPERFLEQQITLLRKAGIVMSQRGAQGGVLLAKPPEEITVYEIVEVLEGALTTVSCTSDGVNECTKNSQCAVQDLWCQIGLAVESVLKGTTLKSLAGRQKHYNQSAHPMYYI
ncbi:MAG: Rrf2 family transcriptional regulator [Rubrobacteridae bacterium]|nr:Rrf2 family transcriptional regulator [Rubrobacteridae bacterium]